MQVRYVFDSDLRQARGRLALALAAELAARFELKAEPADGKLPEAWKTYYGALSRPLPQPRVQLYHGPAGRFQAHPLQWNVWIDPPVGADLKGADEIWRSGGPEAAGIVPVISMPAAAGELPAPGELPMELAEPKVLLCSLPGPDALAKVLNAYVAGFCGREDVTLALQLDESVGEEALMSLLEAAAAEAGADLERINLETWIGPLEPAAYAALLGRADALLAPAEPAQALEALALGKPVVADTTLSPEALKAALETPVPSDLNHARADQGRSALLDAIAARLAHIEAEVDFEARAAAWQEAQDQARQGRKQKYSLFHSDYKEPEMQARRQWHARYARHFEAAPGDVLDIGCGSGIFLEIMRDMGLPAFGVDPDPDMVDVCHELGLQALPGDERHLAEWQPGSLGGIHASHVIEHVDGSRAIALIENAFKALRPGGRLIVRTPNWRNEQVRHEGFWLDITHIRPYPAPLLQQVFSDAGFEIDALGFEDFGWNDTFIIGRKPGGKP